MANSEQISIIDVPTMNTDSPHEQTMTINSQISMIGQNNSIYLLQENSAQKVSLENKKASSVHLDKPFHVSRLRRSELDKIKSLFTEMGNVSHVLKTVYLTGPPGAGKTELARQYGEMFLSERSSDDTLTPLVFTLIASSKESILKSAIEVVQQLPNGFDNTTQNLAILIETLRDYLHQYSGAWLLIIDDMFKSNDFNDLFPHDGEKNWGGGQVLVTTQDTNIVPACHRSAKKFSLKNGMAEEDALALLTEISNVEEDDFTKKIIEKLNRFPLALACCATYVGETRQDRESTVFGWKEYLIMYEKQENEQLESRTYPTYNNVYPFSMTTAISMAVNRMIETYDVLQLAFSFLSYCAFFPLPLCVLAKYVIAHLPPVSNGKKPSKKQIEDEISRCTLLRHGLSNNIETITCHQVIYTAFKDVEETKVMKERELTFVKMMKSMYQSLTFTDDTYKENIYLKVLVRPHLQIFVEYATQMSWNNSPEFSLISMHNAQFLFPTTDMPREKAVESLETLYRISLELNLTDEKRCDIMGNIGFYYLELDLTDDALNFLEKAFKMTDDKSEEEWLSLRCRISYNFAKAYVRDIQIDRGLEMMKTSINLAKKVYAKEEDKIMNRFYWLANFYFTACKFWKVAEVVEEAAKYFLSCSSSSVSLNRARCLSNFSNIYMHCAFFDSIVRPWKYRNHVNLAEKYLNESLDIYEQVLDSRASSHQEYCNLLLLSVLLKMEGRFSGAESQFEKALDICSRSKDKFVRDGSMFAFKKHLFDVLNEKRTSSGCNWLPKIRSLSRGHLRFGPAIDICNEILYHYSTGKISPSQRKINSIRTARSFLVWYNYVLYLFLLLCGCVLLFFCILKL